MECNAAPFSDKLLHLPNFTVTSMAQKVKKVRKEAGVASKLIIYFTYYDDY